MATVEIQGLTKSYSGRRAVENLSIDIRDKEFLAVFGPAGAGKTTTLNLIAGIVTPNSGTVKIGGRDVGGLEPADRNVAMVFESYALYPQLNVFDNMAFPLRSPKFRLPEDKVKERVTHHAKVMKIDHLLDRPIQALSNGQRQRTALGRALVRQPDLFLLDEPLSHLDAKLRHSMRAELKEMRTQLGATTIYVTHDYLEAMSLGDRVAVLNEGHLLQLAGPDDVYFRPASTDVARFFGDPEVNIIDATLKTSGASQLTIQMLGENIPLPLPADVMQVLNEKHTPKIQVGIRPPDVRIATEGDKQAFHATIYSFEPLGTKSILTLKTVDGNFVRALVDGHLTFEIDRRTQFRIDPHLLIIFDAETQKFLARSAESVEEA
ncbi:MAG TPA: ABC transporter ATP-binding protein [Terrimicrobiaceae bacterium]